MRWTREFIVYEVNPYNKYRTYEFAFGSYPYSVYLLLFHYFTHSIIWKADLKKSVFSSKKYIVKDHTTRRQCLLDGQRILQVTQLFRFPLRACTAAPLTRLQPPSYIFELNECMNHTDRKSNRIQKNAT